MAATGGLTCVCLAPPTYHRDAPTYNRDGSTRLVGHEEVEVQENSKSRSGNKIRYSSEQSSLAASTPATPSPLAKTASKLSVILSKNREQIQSMAKLEAAPEFEEEQLPPVFSEARAKELQEEYTLFREVMVAPGRIVLTATQSIV